MKRVKAIALVRKHFPGNQRITEQRIEWSMAREKAAGWHACYVPPCREAHRSIAFLRKDDPLFDVYEAVREDPVNVLPLSLVEHRLGARIDTLTARDQLTRHGLIIRDLSSGTISLAPACCRLARVANFPKYGVSKRGWRVRQVVADVMGLSRRLKKLRDNRRLQTALVLDRLGVDATDICDCRDWVRLRPAWTITDHMMPEYAA